MIRYLILFLVISAVFSKQVTVADFEGPPFSVKPKSGMYQLAGLGFNSLTGGNQVVAYADFNNDKFTDIVTLSDSGLVVTVLIWSHSGSTFISNSTLTFSNKVTSVIPGDFNFDGLVDLLIVENDASTNAYLNLFIRNDIGQSRLFSSTPTLVTKLSYQHPTVVDFIGDRHLQLLVYENNRREVWSLNTKAGYSWQAATFSSFVSNAEGCLQNPNTPFKKQHSNSFIDLNGDCAADLFLQSTDGENNYFEIWMKNTRDGKFCLVEKSVVNTKITPLAFYDIDQNGGLDVIYADYPSDPVSPMNIYIIKNQLPGSPDAPCSAPLQLKSPFTSGGSSNVWTSQNVNSKYSLVFPFSTPEIANPRVFSASEDFPGRIRIGDLNIDGAGDLAFTVPPADKNEPFGSPILLFNLGQSFVYRPEDSLQYYNIKLDDEGNTVQLQNIPALSISFFDFDEIGNLGLWIVGHNSGSATTLKGIFNFVGSEHFFLKIFVLNGYKASQDDGLILGGPYYGPSAECVVTTIDGYKILAKAAQLPQSAHTPLDLSYMYLGLGRTNNYVENLAVGIPQLYNGEPYRVKSWTPIIPNSQLIVNPLWGTEWTLDVYVSPTKETLLVVLTTLVILVVLGLLIIYYHLKEKEEDKKNQDKILHIFG